MFGVRSPVFLDTLELVRLRFWFVLNFVFEASYGLTHTTTQTRQAVGAENQDHYKENDYKFRQPKWANQRK